jgi:hypothetical protein
VMSIFTVPAIPLIPALARSLGLSPVVSGAMIGGSVDTTGAVIASASIAGSEALQAAAVIKMLQNISICVIAVIVATIDRKSINTEHQLLPSPPPTPPSRKSTHSALSPRRVAANEAAQEGARRLQQQQASLLANEAPSPASSTGGSPNTPLHTVKISSEPPSPVAVAVAIVKVAVPKPEAPPKPSTATLIWTKFPKFVLGFVCASLVLSYALPPHMRAGAIAYSFSLSEWASTLGFAGIGLNMRLLEMLGRAVSSAPPISSAPSASTAVQSTVASVPAIPTAPSSSVPTARDELKAVFALYIFGQILDICTSGIVAWLTFGLAK